jgi:hypothetical protein
MSNPAGDLGHGHGDTDPSHSQAVKHDAMQIDVPVYQSTASLARLDYLIPVCAAIWLDPACAQGAAG